MALQIDLSGEMEARLREEASRQGQDASEYVQQFVRRQFVLRDLEALKDRKLPQSLADLKPRVPPPGENWQEGVVSQWPGDESDEEIERLLQEMI